MRDKRACGRLFSRPPPVYVADAPGFCGKKRIRKWVLVALAKRSVCWSKAWSRRPPVGRPRPASFPSPWRPILRLVGVAARLDGCGGDGELVFQRVMGAATNSRSWRHSRKSARRMYFRLLCPSYAHPRAVGLSLISRFPKHGSMNCVCQKDGLLLFSNRSSC